jgi:hypothetical protein
VWICGSTSAQIVCPLSAGTHALPLRGHHAHRLSSRRSVPPARPEIACELLKDYRQFLETRGLALDALGLAERALRREDALLAVDLVEADGGTILGGDVYVEHDGVESAYANWYSERRDDEPSESFAARSRAESRSYIRSTRTHLKGKRCSCW